MNGKIFMVIVVSSLSLNVLADTKKASIDTIPFIVYKTRVIYYSVPVAMPSTLPQTTMGYTSQSTQGSIRTDMKCSATVSAVEQKESISNIPTTNMQNLIRQVRNAVCNSIRDSDVKVWVSIDASGKFLGVGASTQSGLEVTFHCKGKRV